MRFLSALLFNKKPCEIDRTAVFVGVLAVTRGRVRVSSAGELNTHVQRDVGAPKALGRCMRGFIDSSKVAGFNGERLFVVPSLL